MVVIQLPHDYQTQRDSLIYVKWAMNLYLLINSPGGGNHAKLLQDSVITFPLLWSLEIKNPLDQRIRSW